MKINENVSWINDGDELIIINTELQKCIVLDKSGQEIWESITSTNNKTEALNLIKSKYPLEDAEKIEQDFSDLFNLFFEHELFIEA